MVVIGDDGTPFGNYAPKSIYSIIHKQPTGNGDMYVRCNP